MPVVLLLFFSFSIFAGILFLKFCSCSACLDSYFVLFCCYSYFLGNLSLMLLIRFFLIRKTRRLAVTTIENVKLILSLKVSSELLTDGPFKAMMYKIRQY